MASLTPTSVLEKLFKVDPGVARVLLIGLGVFAAIALVGAWQIDESRILPTFVWLAAGYVIFAFLANMPGWLSTFLGSFACLGFAAYVGIFAVQLVGQNVFTPPMMAAGCFFSPAQRGCPMNLVPQRPAPAMVAAIAPTVPPEPGEDPALSFGDAAPGGLPAPAPPRAWNGPSEQPTFRAGSGETYRVYVQYSDRGLAADRVQALAQVLADSGWWVASDLDALASAYGLNEVRYFHEQDRPAALALADEVAEMAPWLDSVRVRDFTRAGEDVRPGLLELWISG